MYCPEVSKKSDQTIFGRAKSEEEDHHGKVKDEFGLEGSL